MSSLFSDHVAHNKMKKLVRQHFQMRGWKLEEDPQGPLLRSLRGTYDIEVTKRDLRFLVRCVDGKIRNFFSESLLVKKFDDDRRNIRRNIGALLIFVVDNSFLDFNKLKLAQNGLLMVGHDELYLITDIENLPVRPPCELDCKERLLLELNLHHCLAVSETERAKGNLVLAIEWVNLTFLHTRGLSVAHKRLFDLFFENKNLDDAERIALAALEFQRDNVEFLIRLRNVYKKRGDIEKVSQLDLQISARKNLAKSGVQRIINHRGNPP